MPDTKPLKPSDSIAQATIIKSRVMGACVIAITITLCVILATYAGFSMYNEKELSEAQLNLFKVLALGLEDIMLMFFTAEIVQRKL